VWNRDRRALWCRAGDLTGHLNPGEMEMGRVGGHFCIEGLEAAQGSQFSSFLVDG
jgi:hypothetical protein